MLVFLSALFGLSLGSFANVCIYRIPRKLSVVHPRSFCPSCGRTLRWYELFPILSFVFLNRQCRTCRSRIPIRYPLVELASGVTSLLMFFNCGLTADFIMKTVLFVLLMIIAIIDWEFLIIPNILVAAGLVLGVVDASLVSRLPIIAAFISALACGAMVFLVRVAGNAVYRKETMGLGDVKLAVLLGLFIGLPDFLLALWLAAALGIAYWLIRHLLSGADRELKLPFGSFLAASSFLLYLAPVSAYPVLH